MRCRTRRIHEEAACTLGPGWIRTRYARIRFRRRSVSRGCCRRLADHEEDAQEIIHREEVVEVEARHKKARLQEAFLAS